MSDVQTEEGLEYLNLRRIDDCFELTYVKLVLRIGKVQAQRVVDLGIERGYFAVARGGKYKVIKRRE